MHAITINLFDQAQAEITDSSSTAGDATGPTETVLVGTDLDDPERQITVEVTGTNVVPEKFVQALMGEFTITTKNKGRLDSHF